MDLGLVSLLIAFLALVLTSLIELKSYRITQRIQGFLEHEAEARGTFTEELDGYLNQYDEETKLTRLEAIFTIAGARMFQAMKMSAMQQKSVDAKTQNRYDNMVHQGIKNKMPFQYKILAKFAGEFLGVDLDDIISAGELPQLKQALSKAGININDATSTGANW